MRVACVPFPEPGGPISSIRTTVRVHPGPTPPAPVAAHHLNGNENLVLDVKADPQHAAISEKLKALLVIAGKTAKGGKHVTAEDVDRARRQGATDLEIHDTVLIAAIFCLCNRYVDGLATWAPDDPDFYRQRAALVAATGYAASGPAANTMVPSAAGKA